MLRTPSGNLLSSFHSHDKWEEQGGWEPKEQKTRCLHQMERDASMVHLLNLVDPDSLVDNVQQEGELMEREEQQHSALSERGVVFVGGLSAFAWYAVRLVLRDLVSFPDEIMELHAISTVHAVGWAVFFLKKIGASETELPKYCSRALVASLGYHLQDCWALRGTLLSSPFLLMHRASMVATISSILRSKGVAWLAMPIMSQAVPNLLQELLRLCGSIGLTAVRPEVRGLRILWFLTFVMSKLAIVPTWFRYHIVAEMHQPNLFYGKLSYFVCFALDLLFLRSAVRDLPQFLKPDGMMLPAVMAYKMPLQRAKTTCTAIIAAAAVALGFGSYLTAPVALAFAFMGLRSGSLRWIRFAGFSLCSIVALDKICPQPEEFPTYTLWLMPIVRQILKNFNFRIFPNGLQFWHDLPKDRHHLIATTPHGLFPLGAFMVIGSCIDAGYLPNFVGASVLGVLPVAGRLLRSLGFIPASKKEILKCLKKEYPRNVTIILPGGIREMFQIREDIEISASNLHTGFCDIAKQGGAIVVPSYAFGVSKLFKVATGPLATFFAQLSRKIQTSILLFAGRWGTLLPYPHEMACAMGEPIDTLECVDGNEVHRLYLQRLRVAFEEYKGPFGWQEKELYFEGEEMPDAPEDPIDGYISLPSSHHSKL